jgi:hypothetical protein
MNYVKEERVRFQLRQAWNTGDYKKQLEKAGLQRIVTPFRAVNNAGDLLSRQNYVCGGSSQQQSRPGLKGLRLGSILSNCDGTGVPSATCNGKYVYDSSNYVTYLKQAAIQKKDYNRKI